MPDAKTVQRQVLLEQTSAAAELYVFCPLFRGQVELERCVSCEFYRGLSPQRESCHVLCRFPDQMFAVAVAAGGASS